MFGGKILLTNVVKMNKHLNIAGFVHALIRMSIYSWLLTDLVFQLLLLSLQILNRIMSTM